MKTDKKFTTVSIPTTIFEKAKDFIENTGFPSVSSFTAYLLREIIIEKRHPKRAFSHHDEEKIKRKLKEMGYL